MLEAALLLGIFAAEPQIAFDRAIFTSTIEYKHGDVILEGVLAQPEKDEGNEKRPGVLIVHEWWGRNDFVEKTAQELASLGYVAFALDMYGKGVLTDDPKEAAKLAGSLRGKPILRERARAGLDVLLKNKRVDPKRVAAIGYCFGGTTCLELAYDGAPLAGIVSFHGGLTNPKPEDSDRIKARLLVLHGADDPFVPKEQVAAFTDAVRAAKADWQLVAYGGAVHSFTNPKADNSIPGACYDEKAARRSWEHMKAFFAELFAK